MNDQHTKGAGTNNKTEPLAQMIHGGKNIFDAISDIIFILNLKQQILFANKKALTTFNFSWPEIKGKNCHEVLNKNKQISEECPIPQVRNSLHRESIEVKINNHWMILHIDPILDKNSVLLGFFIIFNDITKSKQMELSLIESETKFKHVFESSNVGKSITSPSGKIFVNKAFCKMLGYNEEELSNKTWQEITPPEEIEPIQKILDLLLTGEKNSARFRKRYFHKKGYYVWADVSVAVPRDDEGNVIQFITTVIDISESKRIEDALKESEEKLRLFIEHAPAALAMFDRNMRYIAVSRRWILEFQLQETALIGKSHYEIFPEIPDELKKIHQRGMNGEIIKSEDNKFERVDGSIQWLSWEMWPWRTATGSVGGIIIFSEDITERKHSEEMLSNIQKLESLGVLAGGIAHDFNNLLGGMSGFIESALVFSTDKSIIKYLTSTLDAIDQARGLTEQLLTFAKGGTPIMKIGRLFPFIEETAKFALSGSNITCTFTIPDDLWLCEFDKNRINQVINNLIINAQQSMPNGGTIELSAQNIVLSLNDHLTLPAGDYVLIKISDHGTGIPRKILSKIFDPFFSTKFKGYGLGLTTSYSIINRHGGSIDVESEPGKGSTFFIYLPAKRKGVLITENVNNETHQGSGIFVVVDDEAVIRESLKIILEFLGYNVVLIEDGKDAIEYFIKEKTKITGMLFDLTIPGGMGGKEAIIEIRKYDSEIPVFVSSGYADDPVIANPREYGFTASISKPFRKTALAAILNKYIPKKE